MRTKTMLLTAACVAAGALSSMAQNVYSVNVVGYYNITVPGHQFALISEQLGGPNNDYTVNDQLTNGVPDGSSLLFFTGTSFNAYTFFAAGPGWYDSNLNLVTNSIPPGTGAFIQNGGTTPATITIVGQVYQGTNTLTVTPGFQIYSLAQPIATNLDSTLVQFPAADGDSYLHWNVTAQNYDPALTYFAAGPGWFDSNLNQQYPTPQVGEAVFVQHTAAATNWTYSFTVQ